jgi:hypothetical protein
MAGRVTIHPAGHRTKGAIMPDAEKTPQQLNPFARFLSCAQAVIRSCMNAVTVGFAHRRG